MKRFLALAVLAAPFAACGCAHSYDPYRSREVRTVTSDGYELPQSETRSRTLPRARVIYSSDVQGGYGPGSYGGHGGTVITPQDDGTVIIEGEYHGR